MMDAGHLTPLALFAQAGLVGKSVIIILVTASILCWYRIIIACINIVRIKTAIANFSFTQTHNLLCSVYEAGCQAQGERFDAETFSEMRARLVEAMNRQASFIMIDMEAGLTLLAVIASISPFVGLLGTVWGIMVSFTSIADANDTSLAVVAPGIAEALATTAFGLLAAIPASVGYSALGAAFAKETQKLSLKIDRISLDIIRNGQQARS
jgi:biopolymer transport protein ExbB/TolQ